MSPCRSAEPGRTGRPTCATTVVLPPIWAQASGTPTRSPISADAAPSQSLDCAPPFRPDRDFPAAASGRRSWRRCTRRCTAVLEMGCFERCLLHHPPGLLHQHGRKGLDDATAFRAVIADAGAELILHGHEHRFRSETIEGRHGPVPVIGVPSASAALGHCKEPAQYHLYRVQPVSHGWCLRILRRRLADDTGRFADVGWHTIDLPRPRTSPLVEPSRTPATDGC